MVHPPGAGLYPGRGCGGRGGNDVDLQNILNDIDDLIQKRRDSSA